LLFAVVYGFVGLVLTVDFWGWCCGACALLNMLLGQLCPHVRSYKISFIVTNFLLGFVVCRMVRRVVADG